MTSKVNGSKSCSLNERRGSVSRSFSIDSIIGSGASFESPPTDRSYDKVQRLRCALPVQQNPVRCPIGRNDVDVDRSSVTAADPGPTAAFNRFQKAVVPSYPSGEYLHRMIYLDPSFGLGLPLRGAPPPPPPPPIHPIAGVPIPWPAAAYCRTGLGPSVKPMFPDWLFPRPDLCMPSALIPGSDAAFLFPFRKPKRIRTAFSPQQLMELEEAFEKNHYLVGQERKDLAHSLNLSETQVKVWFQNRRTKHKRVLTDDGSESKEPGSSTVNSTDDANEATDDDDDDDDDGQDEETSLRRYSNNNNNNNNNNCCSPFEPFSSKRQTTCGNGHCSSKVLNSVDEDSIDVDNFVAT